MTKMLTKRRDIRSFEAEPDVARMLGRARSRGVKLTYLCNNALRQYLTTAGYARKKEGM
jgi:hypothetical protein